MNIRSNGKLTSVLGREAELAAENRSTIRQLREQIVAIRHAAAQPLQERRARACIGDAIAFDDHRITARDEIEFLAPVSGG